MQINYDLQAVVTHRDTMCASDHYVAIVREDDKLVQALQVHFTSTLAELTQVNILVTRC